MRFRGILLAPVVWFLVAGAGSALAQDGISVRGALAQFTSSGTISTGTLAGEPFTIGGTGLSLGVEYEFALSEESSVSPFLMLSQSSASSTQLVFNAATHMALGAQMRFRREEYLYGVHLAGYSEALSGGGVGAATGSGLGIGVVGRWEREDGMFVGGQFDVASLSFTDSSSILIAFQVQLGYRWGMEPGLIYNPPPRTPQILVRPATVQPPSNQQPAVEPLPIQAPTEPQPAVEPLPIQAPVEPQPAVEPTPDEAPSEPQAETQPPPSEEPAPGESNATQ